MIWGSDDAALAEGVAELPTDRLRELRRELRDWNGSREASEMDIVRFLQDGFGVNRVFKKPDDARAFMDKVDAELLRVVKERTEGNWKP